MAQKRYKYDVYDSGVLLYENVSQGFILKEIGLNQAAKYTKDRRTFNGVYRFTFHGKPLEEKGYVGEKIFTNKTIEEWLEVTQRLKRCFAR